MTFTIRYDYAIVPTTEAWRRFETRNLGYWYEIGDADGREIMAFHWHPVGASPISFPHLHFSGRSGSIAIDEGHIISIAEMHIPTGRVSLSDIVRLLIAEFGVEPRRTDWEAILDRIT